MTQPQPDFKDLLVEFDKAGVEYLIIGGYAVSLHGKPRFTKDFAVWIGASATNLAKARVALAAYGAPDFVVAQIESEAEILWMGAHPNRVEVFKRVLGGDFEKAYAARVVVSWGGSPVSLVSRDYLIALKRAAGRPQDLADIDNLETSSRK